MEFNLPENAAARLQRIQESVQCSYSLNGTGLVSTRKKKDVEFGKNQTFTFLFLHLGKRKMLWNAIIHVLKN